MKTMTSSPGSMPHLDPEHHLLERHPLDLRHRVVPQVLVVPELGVQVEAEAGHDAAGAALALEGVGLGVKRKVRKK